MQDIRTFYRNAVQRDFSRDFLFRVEQIVIAGIPAFSEDELVYATAASLPGRDIENVTAPYMGLDFNIPGRAKYPGSDAYQLTFNLDANSSLRTKLEQASRTLFDDATSTGSYGTPGTESYILLAQLDKQLNPISRYKLVGSSIRNISNVDYKIAEGVGSIVTFTGTFAYHFYEIPLVTV